MDFAIEKASIWVGALELTSVAPESDIAGNERISDNPNR